MPEASEEGTARVVAVEGGMAWLEPEQSTACGGCHAAAACGVKPGSGRLAARRFAIPNDHDLRVGERVVVAVAEGVVLRAALTAYGLPLLFMLAGGLIAQKLYGDDLVSMAATVAGLAFGIVAVRWRTGRLNARGELTPRYVRRAFGPAPGGTCQGSEG